VVAAGDRHGEGTGGEVLWIAADVETGGTNVIELNGVAAAKSLTGVSRTLPVKTRFGAGDGARLPTQLRRSLQLLVGPPPSQVRVTPEPA